MNRILFISACVLMFYGVTVLFAKMDREFLSKHLSVTRIVPYMAFNLVIIGLIYPFVANETVIYTFAVMVYMMFTCYIDINYKKIYSFPTYVILLFGAGCIVFGYMNGALSLTEIMVAVVWNLLVIVVFVTVKMGRGDVGLIMVFNTYVVIISSRLASDTVFLISRLSKGLLITVAIYILYSVFTLLCQHVIRKGKKKMIPFAPAVYMAFILVSVNYS